MKDDRDSVNSYLARGVHRHVVNHSLPMSSSPWLDEGKIREVLAIWMLRKNGPDFPVEADHTLGLLEAMHRVRPAEEIDALIAEERKINARFDAYMAEGFLSRYRNEDFEQHAPGTVGAIMWHAVHDLGFDLTQGVDVTTRARPESDYSYWFLRNRQQHDFEHCITGGGLNSIGEIVCFFTRMASHATHLSPQLASAFNAYIGFAGMRLIARSILHYPQTVPKVLECVEQGIRIGRSSEPIWEFHYEDVLDLTPDEARAKLGVRHAYDIDSTWESQIFRNEDEIAAIAAE